MKNAERNYRMVRSFVLTAERLYGQLPIQTGEHSRMPDFSLYQICLEAWLQEGKCFPVTVQYSLSL